MTTARNYLGRAVQAPFAIGVLAVAVFAIWAARDAGYEATTWYPGALFIVALAVVAALAYTGVRPATPALIAIGCLALFAAWSALSIRWSSDKGIAWDGANRTILYAFVFTLFASLPWRRESLPLLLCGFSIVVATIGAVDLIRASNGDVARYFIFGRMSAPAGYPNAAAALYLLSIWPPLYAATRRELPAVARAGLLAVATVLGELALLAESRGSLFAVPVTVVLYLLVVPRRLRAGLALTVVALAVALARGPLVDVYDPLNRGESAQGPLHHALVAIAVSSLVVLVAWAGVAEVDRRLDLSTRTIRLANRLALVAAAAALLGGCVALAVSTPGPADRLSSAWHHFKAGYSDQPTHSHFSSGLGNNRYDFWRVAVIELRDHPVRGIGADNFAEPYVRLRRSGEEPLYPHSLELRTLAETGLVGGLLFAGFVVFCAVSVRRGAGRRDDVYAGIARAGVVGAAYWAIHGSADWFWEFPGLTAPALAWLGLAAPPPRLGASARARLVPIAVTVLAVAAAVSFVFPFLSARLADRAAQTWSGHAARAFADLDRARALNPLSAHADILAGGIASRLDELPRMRTAFEHALQRDPGNWYAHFELALADAGLHRRAPALEQLALAGRMNPKEDVIDTVRTLVLRRRPIDRDRIDRLFVRRVHARVGP